MLTKNPWRVPLLAAASLVVCVAAAHAQATAPGNRQTSPPEVKLAPFAPIATVDGRDNFQAYCAVCHGTDARGKGPAAPAMKASMPDLTTMAARNGGKFDAAATEYIIRGTGKTATPAHGTAEMPIWGPVFLKPADASGNIRIVNLVRYIESLQRK
jgi:mono/diheme cytochrome c family protein